MASVKSLGLHQPSGLRYAIDEQLIDAGAPTSSYAWDITTDDGGQDRVEDELLTTRNCVIWCRGRIFRKAFKFDLEKEPVIHALLAYFPKSEDAKADRTTFKNPVPGSPALQKALVVFLKTQAHIYFLSGTSHVVHMPFEVESACAGPVGVIIQRRAKTENVAPVSLKFPRVPPNSFVSSQLTAFNCSQQTAFSTEGLGNPKALHLSLRSTLENMWDAPMEQAESHWPRLVSLTDPLADIGLIVTDLDPHSHRAARKATSRKPPFLDPAEELLHVERIRLPVAAAQHMKDPLILGVTVNRENSSYTVWRLTYLSHEDPFVSQHTKTKNRATRRRSSMQPGFASGASTPVQQNFRESLGAPLPGKRLRRSDKFEKPLDLVSSLEQQDNDGSAVPRRSSRRLSSMLARADLSASHERAVFTEQPLVSNSGTSKRHDHGRSSSSFHPIHPSLGSLLEAPVDVTLDEGLHNMGLDDHDFDGLQHEIRFTRIHTISSDNSNVRYSTSAQPARSQAKVFILTAPPYAADEQQRTQLLVGIQDSLERRLHLMTIHVTLQEKFGHVTASLVPREQWKVHNVVDSSKLVDDNLSVILVLSESMDGRHELSTQAPWIELTKISLSLLFVDDTRSLQFHGRARDRDVKQRKSEVIDVSNGSVVGIRYPRQRGVVDVLDTEGRLHQLRIQLQPSCPQVRRALDICKSVLPNNGAGRVHAGWLHVMQWLQDKGESVASVEWSAFATILLASFLNLGRPESRAFQTARLPVLAVDIFMALHLLLEEQKLDITTPEYVALGRVDLRVLLCQIARWLKWHDFSSIYELGIQEDVDPRHDTELNLKSPIPQPPVRPDVFEWIQSRFIGLRGQPCLTPADIYYASSRQPEASKLEDQRWDTITPRTLMFKRFFKLVRQRTTAVQMVEAMRDCGFNRHVLETLPEAISAPLQDAISLCQPHPPSEWTNDLLDLVKRSDISLILVPKKRPRIPASSILAPTHTATWDFRLLCQSVEETNNIGYDEGEGTERQAVIRALFKDDRRLNEAQDLLSTHKARLVRLEPNPSWPESEYLEKQKELVSRIATGTLAIPAGRALLYYSLRYPLITQKFHIGGFNLNCVVKPANVTVGVDKALFTEEKVCWGFFHQGVAAGLAISPQAKGIDTSWILYNKPGQELSNRHAGFLLALGLNGHLKGVAKWVAFKYLTPKHTMTSVGLLLGLAASYMGTMDSLITRLLSVHATRMLPRGAAELNLSPLTQTSGIMGIGLLYCNSQHRRMSEIMLSEIEQVDEEDEEEPLRSECYRLAAGFALGFINLGKGNDLKGLHDMQLTEKLLAHATATKNVEIVHILDRAAAGAVMAIALIFMKSEDQIVARKIDVPDSVLQFDYVRPDILLLRTVTKHLILWSKVEPSFAWIRDNLPAPYRAGHRLLGVTKLRSTDLPFFSIVTGLCFAIALRFSGSASTRVRDILLHYLDQFMHISSIAQSPRADPDAGPLYDEELARSNARMCQDILAISCSIVMAGTGDIPILRRLRALHGRDDPDTPYGSHLAAHLAVGALFLGCGTTTFGTNNMATAALLVAFYPVFPTSVMDNRSHLQAFRYFWVLATEQRCLVAKDVLTGQPVSVSVQIKMKSDMSTESTLNRTTPCLLPPLDQIASLSTGCGPQYWDVELDLSNDALRTAFAETLSLYLRRRPPREGPFPSTLRALGRDSKEKNPLEWVFGLDGLSGITYAEKVDLLESAEREPDAGSALDARLELERGILDGGDRERLEGARLLFEWGAVRERRLLELALADDSQATVKAEAHDEGVRSGDVWWMRDGAIESLQGQVWLAARDGREPEP
ncbi:anaphase-promoting complex subunit 1 domain-containing protein [Hirsutella rhossiliensis]|uniref:Anaphase-promoting complex subunit 1 domain-containing protein n=1 Tax=Hirsutella rhossiliensis TaxID=111463 RepID=A0A9P8SL44_9HYPO|nr:anaphase-promoting complex subunit 1 domain-containing protein [Hirsutella rhossiliensis]KAH0965435.1 anaphase-promoting complex subunit 1 domain-containing protein [Hirsutella rhossiliensis]